MGNVPTWNVEAAWENAISGLVVIGGSLIGSDIIGGSFAYASWTSVPEVQEFSVTRGKSSDLSEVQAGRAVLKLFDATGKYNPLNTSSPLYGKLNPMRPLRIKATDPADASVRTLYYGFIQSIEYDADPNVETATIECVDLFEWLNHSYPSISTLTNNDVGTIIGRILTEIGWTQPSFRSLSTGKTVPSWSADGTLTALELIQALLDVDLGVFYVAGDGVVTYKSAKQIYAAATAATTFTQSQARAVRPSTLVDRVTNKQSVTKQGSTAQTAQDATSIQNYGQRVGAGITSAYLENDAQADSLARLIVATRKDPLSPARPISLLNKGDASGAILTQQLLRDLYDYVTVSDSVYGTALSGRIEQIAHEGWEGGQALRTEYLITNLTVAWITIGQSTIGSAHIVGY